MYKDIYTERQQNILVVDDEPLVLDALSDYLGNKGYNIDTAKDGEMALEKLNSHSFDLVLTDLKMPNADGHGLLKFMSEKYPEIPKIVLTGYGEEKDILFALKAGANDFLFKPIGDFNILQYSISKVLSTKKLNDDKNRYFEQINQINDIISLLNKGKTTEEIFKSLCLSLKKVIPYNRMSLVQIDKINNRLISKLIDSDREKIIKENFFVPVNLSILENYPQFKNKFFISNLNEYIPPDKYTSTTFSQLIELLKKESMQSTLILPLIIDEELEGYLHLSSITPGFFKQEHITFMESIAGHIALSIQRGKFLDNLENHTKNLQHLVDVRTNEILKTQRTTLFALAKLTELRDHETGEHLERIRRYSILTAQIYKYTNNKNNIDNNFLRDLYDSSILHDIGKVGVPDSILKKEGPLTTEEFKIIKNHIFIGYNALKTASKDLGENSFLKMAMDIILYHHERWDGSGYPEGLKGEEIPLAARIISICDVYDALVSKRPYKEAFSHEKALKIMKESASDFDPDLFKIFIDNELEYDFIRKQYQDR